MGTEAARPLPAWLRSRALPVFGAAVGLLLLIIALAFLRYQRLVFAEEARVRAELFARVLDDQVARSLDSVELLLLSLVPALESSGTTPDAGARSAWLAEAIRNQPALRSLSWLDERGRVVASSNPRNIGLTPDGALRDTRQGLGPVQLGRDLGDLRDARGKALSGGPSVLPLVRSTQQPRGQLLALLNTDYFANQPQLTLADSPFHAAVLAYDGQLIAATEGVSQHAGSLQTRLPIFSQFLPHLEKGSYVDQGLDGSQQISAFRTARRHPVIVLVEAPVSVVEERVRQLAWRVGGALSAAWLLLATLTLLAWRSLRSHERVRRDLAATQGTLVEQDLFTERLFAASPVPMVVKDRAGRYLRVNKAWSDFVGLAPEAVLDAVAAPGQLLPDDAAHLLAMEQMAMSLGEAVHCELPVNDARGQRRDVAIRLVPYRGVGDEVRGVIACWMDVTEFREAERQTQAAMQAAEKSHQAKSEFIANMSHELRTPLQSILGYSELGLHRVKQDPKLLQMFQSIHGGGQRMLALVNNLLDLSRVSSAVGEVQLSMQDLAPLLREVLEELAPLALERGIQVDASGASAELPTLADGVRMQQVLRNVLANALRFAPHGSRVVVFWGPTDQGGTRLEVSDQGPGIPEEELESVFEPFVQSSRTKDGSGGTGLGLAICRKIVESHHGHIRARNLEAGGAIFEIELPGR